MKLGLVFYGEFNGFVVELRLDNYPAEFTMVYIGPDSSIIEQATERCGALILGAREADENFSSFLSECWDKVVKARNRPGQYFHAGQNYYRHGVPCLELLMAGFDDDVLGITWSENAGRVHPEFEEMGKTLFDEHFIHFQTKIKPMYNALRKSKA